eukprot:g2355.t1
MMNDLLLQFKKRVIDRDPMDSGASKEDVKESDTARRKKTLSSKILNYRENEKERIRISRSGMQRPILPFMFSFEIEGRGKIIAEKDRGYVSYGIAGQIYIVREEKSKRQYAMKIFRKKKHRDIDPELSFLSQFASDVLVHPNIIGFELVCPRPLVEKRNIDCGCVLMEFAENGELFDYIADEPFDEPLARYFMKQIVCAVAHLHRNGIVHRDLKPENFLLDREGNLRLCDFGHAKKLERRTPVAIPASASDATAIPPRPPQLRATTTKFVASPAYKTPKLNDLKKGESYDATKVDSWEIGVCMFVMLSQTYPFGTNKSTINKAELDKLLDAKGNRKFWKEWEDEYIYFSDDAKKILNRIFCTSPAARASVCDIAESRWINDAKIPSRNEVAKELSRRARELDLNIRLEPGE